MRIRPPRFSQPTATMFVERYYYGLGWEDYSELQVTVTGEYSRGEPGDMWQPPEPEEITDICAVDAQGREVELTPRELEQAETLLLDAVSDEVDARAVDMAIDRMEARR